jgi:hypothetical protein
VDGRRTFFGLVATSIPVIVAACGSHDAPSSRDSIDVGPTGGTVEVGGVLLDIPSGALDRVVTLAVSADAPHPSGYRVDGATYRFSPAGLVFAKEIAVTFPTGTATESAFWSVQGDSERYERLATVVDRGYATTHVRHFSTGFVGTAEGVTCTTRRRDGFTCSQSTTVESPVHLWLVPSPNLDPEGALATDSPGVHALYNNPDPNAPFFLSNATHTLYEGYQGGGDFGTAYRSGNVVSLTFNAARGGSVVPGCETIPLIAVSCSGTTELAPPDVVDSGVGVLPGPSPSNDASDGNATIDGDASAGLTCISQRRVSDGVTCSQSTTVESPVHLWLVAGPNLDPEGALATDSPGVHALYNNPDPNAPFFVSDATHTLYQGYQGGGDFGTAYRSGNAVSFTLDAGRGGAVLAGCETIPLIHVTCSGATFLGK